MEEAIIDLNKIPILWTTCDKSKDRHGPLNSMLSNLNLKGIKINGPITTPYTIGVAVGYTEALSKYDPPFLILEDDATLVRSIDSLSFKYPFKADALYLGTSVYGRIKGKTTPGGVIAADAGNTARVFNMLGFHAVVYFTKDYVNHVINILNSFISNPVGGCDDPIAESMWKYNVYSLKSPVFYQKDGRSDQATQQVINTLI